MSSPNGKRSSVPSSPSSTPLSSSSHSSKHSNGGPAAVSIAVRVNRAKFGSTLGPFLDRKKVHDMPEKFGPGPISKVVRESVQRIVDSSLNQKEVFGLLRTGDSRVIIAASFEDKMPTVRLPRMEAAGDVRDFLEILFEELRCENFYEVTTETGGKRTAAGLNNGEGVEAENLTQLSPRMTTHSSLGGAPTSLSGVLGGGSNLKRKLGSASAGGSTAGDQQPMTPKVQRLTGEQRMKTILFINLYIFTSCPILFAHFKSKTY